MLPNWQRVCTADALHTHAEFMRVIHTGSSDCLTVKGNQPILYADLASISPIRRPPICKPRPLTAGGDALKSAPSRSRPK